MAKLSDEEQSLLKRLTAKAEAPEPDPVRKSVNFNLDLSNPEHFALAKREGWLTPDDPPPPSDGDGDGDGDGDEKPRRTGYFKD